MFSKVDIEKYFLAEKNAGLFLMILAAVAIAAALYFFFAMKTNWYKGFAVPLLCIALLQGLVGYTVYRRSDADRKRNVYAYDLNPAELKTKELPRMQKVNKNFNTLLLLQAALLIAGIALFFYFRKNETRLFWSGFGLALALQALLSFGFDLLASSRANTYTNALKNFVEKNN